MASSVAMMAKTRHLIGRPALSALEDYLADEGTLRKIADLFDDAEVERDEAARATAGGQRRTLFTQYLASLHLDRREHAARLLKVFDRVLADLRQAVGYAYDEDGTERARRDAIHQKIIERLARDGISLVGDHLVLPTAGVDAAPLRSHAVALDADQIRFQLDRLRQHDSDPALAIGTAKELIETTCKTILKERSGKEPDGSPDLPDLVKQACKVLKLAPEDVPDAARAAEEVRKLLRTLGNIPQALATIRNVYGTGHGPEGRTKGLQPRHARLAANSAIALAVFLLDTHQER